MAHDDWDGDVPVQPRRCERCGERDPAVRLYESGDPKRLGTLWRLLQLHPACFDARQREVRPVVDVDRGR